MTSLIIAACICMFVCYAFGALLAWLLAVAFYPTQEEARKAAFGLLPRHGGRRR